MSVSCRTEQVKSCSTYQKLTSWSNKTKSPRPHCLKSASNRVETSRLKIHESATFQSLISAILLKLASTRVWVAKSTQARRVLLMVESVTQPGALRATRIHIPDLCISEAYKAVAMKYLLECSIISLHNTKIERFLRQWISTDHMIFDQI